MIVVDTTVWIDYFRGTRTPHADWLETNLTSERLGLTDLILCEVLQGVPTDSQFDAVQEVAAIAQGDDAAKSRMRAFLDGKAAKVAKS